MGSSQQSEQADPAKFFDDENAEKRVAGAGLPTGNVITTRDDLVQEAAPALLLCV